MSQSLVDRCRRAVAAWNRRDFEGWVAEVPSEWRPGSSVAVEAGTYRGRPELQRAFDEILETWETFQLEEREVRDLGDSVLWLGRVHARGRTSGIERDEEFAIRMTSEASETFFSWRQGLEAAGLRE